MFFVFPDLTTETFATVKYTIPKRTRPSPEEHIPPKDNLRQSPPPTEKTTPRHFFHLHVGLLLFSRNINQPFFETIAMIPLLTFWDPLLYTVRGFLDPAGWFEERG